MDSIVRFLFLPTDGVEISGAHFSLGARYRHFPLLPGRDLIRSEGIMTSSLPLIIRSVTSSVLMPMKSDPETYIIEIKKKFIIRTSLVKCYIQ